MIDQYPELQQLPPAEEGRRGGDDIEGIKVMELSASPKKHHSVHPLKQVYQQVHQQGG